MVETTDRADENRWKQNLMQNKSRRKGTQGTDDKRGNKTKSNPNKVNENADRDKWYRKMIILNIIISII